MTGRWAPRALLALLLGACTGDTAPSGETGGGELGDGLDSYDDGGSGGAEDSGFGMDDDMPLVTAIRQIKLGEIAVGTLVTVEHAVVVTPEGELPGGPGFFLRDLDGAAFTGLRVVGTRNFTVPARGQRARFTGLVDRDEHGLDLRLTRLESSTATEEPTAVRAERASILPGSSDRDGLLDLELQVQDANGLPMVVGEEIEPGLWVLGEGLVLDLRAFEVTDAELFTGASLEMVTGVLMIDGDRSALLPRSADDLVPSQ